MKEKVIDAPEDDDTDFFAIVDEAEVDLQRIMKNDMDNFVAKQNQIEEFNKDMKVASMFGENDSPQPSGGFSPF